MKKIAFMFLSLTLIISCLTGGKNIENSEVKTFKLNKVEPINKKVYGDIVITDHNRNISAGSDHIDILLTNMLQEKSRARIKCISDLIENEEYTEFVDIDGEKNVFNSKILSIKIKNNMPVGKYKMRIEVYDGEQTTEDDTGVIEFDVHINPEKEIELKVGETKEFEDCNKIKRSSNKIKVISNNKIKAVKIGEETIKLKTEHDKIPYTNEILEEERLIKINIKGGK